MKRKIAVFANGWSAENLRYYMESLSEHLEELNADLYVFMGHDAFGMRPIHNDAQCCIYDLPNLKDYDAIIFFALGMDFVQINEAIFARCRESGVPMIIIGKTLEGAVSIYTDQYKGMKPLVDHLLEKHNIKKILFIAGPRDHFDSNERLRATMDSCKEHGVPFSGDDVFYSNWDVMSATTYMRKLLNKKTKLPDVIMCANDTTAFFISFVLEEYGYEVPRDVLLTGFDGTFKAKTFYPSLTSVAQPLAKMGKKTAECLSAIFEGRPTDSKYYIPSEFMIGESCGCDVTAERDVIRRQVCRQMPSEQARNGFRQGRIHYMELAVLKSERYATLKDTLQEYFYASDGQEGNPFFIFIDPMLGKLGECEVEELPKFTFSNNLDMLVGKHGQMHYDAENRDIREGLLPELPDDGKHHMYFFMPLFVGSFICGYMVMADSTDYIDLTIYATFQTAINTILETYVKNLKLSALNDKLSDLLNKDAMTGVRNRVAYESYMLSLKDRIASGDHADTAFVMFDLNDLKMINDTYGHEKGDAYIRNGCKLICDTFSHSIVFRIGGDEFVAVLWGNDYDNREKLLDDFKYSLEAIEASDCSPEQKVSIACGIAVYDSVSGEKVEHALRRADDAMYADKRRIKQERAEAEKAE